MTEVTVTARFYREKQPVQYEKAGADVTISSVAASPADAGKFLDEAQRAVLAALDKSHEFRPANGETPKASTVVVVPDATALSVQGNSSGTETPKAEGEKRRGRPPKADKPVTKEVLDDALAAAAGQPEPNAAAIAGVDVGVKVDAKDLPEVTVEEMQTACSNAAMKLGSADKVRALYKVNYKVDRVAEIETEFRRPFLKDLATLVDKELAAKGATS